MSYISRTQKEITLPSGGRITVRRQTKLEAILIGQPPAWFIRKYKAEEAAEAAKSDPEKHRQLLEKIQESTPEQDQEMLKYFSTQSRIFLTRCCISDLETEGEKLKIVDKDPEQTAAGEISWALIDDADVAAINSAINELGGVRKAGQEAVTTTFQETPKGTQGN